MNKNRKFLFSFLGFFGAMGSVIALQAGLFYYKHAPYFEKIPPEFKRSLLIFLILASISLMGLVGVGLHYLFTRYFSPVGKMTESLEALVYGNAKGMLDLDETEALKPLAEAVNALLLRTEKGNQAPFTDGLIDKSEAEGAVFEAVFHAQEKALVVCASNGQILQYNKAARHLLGGQGDIKGPDVKKHGVKGRKAMGCLLGRGKHLSELIPQALIDYSLEALEDQLSTGTPHPITEFDMPVEPGTTLRFQTIPLVSAQDELFGFILCSDHQVTHSADQSSKKQPLKKHSFSTYRKDQLKEPLENLRFVVFDTETTGLNPREGDEIIELGAVPVFKGEVLRKEEFETYVDPGRPVGEASFQVHGIPPENLAGQPTITDILPDFSRYVGGAVLVAHNAAFDMAFLRMKEKKAGVVFGQMVLDTMVLSSLIHPQQKSHSLDALLERYGIGGEKRHSALGDAIMTAELLVRLLPALKTRGIQTLGDALEASRKSPLAKIAY